MARKMDIYSSYGQKLISLFVRLLFSGESFSLTELARMLNCSKQTVLRLLDDIGAGYKIEIEETRQGNRKYVRLKRPERAMPISTLSEMEMQVLQMCRQFTAHLLGRELFEEATRALLKSQALLGTARESSSAHFAAFQSGTIDYTPYHDTIQTLIEAMEAKKVCKISYQAVEEKRAKTFYIKPLKIFSCRDALYLHAQKAMDPSRRFRAPKFDPLLAVHRMKDVEMTERKFEFPQNYDFEKIFNRSFGIIKQETFEVEAEFTGWAAKYVAERIWSPNQRVTRLSPEAVRLTFSASSKPEVLSWVLSFGEEARVLGPECMVERVRKAIEAMRLVYKP